MVRKLSENPKAVYMREWRARGGPAVERDRERSRERWRDDTVYRVQQRHYRRAWRQRRAGLHLTRQEELAVYEASDGLCALCYEEPATVIDHDHETGEVRGALCNGCNRTLGQMGDNEAGVRRALDYLTTASQWKA